MLQKEPLKAIKPLMFQIGGLTYLFYMISIKKLQVAWLINILVKPDLEMTIVTFYLNQNRIS